MGLVNLPSVDDIQQQKDPKQQMEMLINTLGLLMKELGEINGYLGGANIRAKSIQAEKIDVNELSALSANLGHITAGLIESIEIFGSYIATSQTYPKVEVSNTENLVKASMTPNDYVALVPVKDGSPTFVINSLLYGTLVNSVNSTGHNYLSSGRMKHIAAEGIELNPGALFVDVPAWGKVKQANGKTLQQEFDDLRTELITEIGMRIYDVVARATFAANAAFDPGTRNLKLYNGYGNTIATVNIP